MQRLNILRLKDQNNWAYDHIAREQAKYSRHNITCKRIADVTIDDLNGIDILYIPGPNMSGKQMPFILEVKRKFPKCKIIGGYAGEHEIMYSYADAIVSISAKFYPKLKELYKDRKIPVVFLPESADTEFFIPAKFPETFTIGWSGRKSEVKRIHLLDRLCYPVKIQSDHGSEFFKEFRPLDPMRSFYQSISCLVLTSYTEAMPRVVLEAMSCGLAVVTTDVGSLRMIMDSMWIVPTHPESIVVKDMNARLKMLSSHPEILKEAGQRNRSFIEQYFSWKVNQPMWDQFFTEMSLNHLTSVESYNREYRTKYGELEPNLLK